MIKFSGFKACKINLLGLYIDIINKRLRKKNEQKYSTMMKIRSISLKLRWRAFNNAADKTCNLCSIEVETLEYFMLDCIKLNELREEFLHLQLPRNKNRAELINAISLFHKDAFFLEEYFLNMMQRLWILRNLLLKRELLS